MRPSSRAFVILALAGVVMLLGVLAAPAAFAGRSSTGELAFYPCTRCHPVTLDAAGNPVPPLPNGFKKHDITLEVHDVLGTDDKACLACHQAPTKDPGKLVLPDGSLVEVTGDVSRVCQRCHFEKYREWQVGIHGKDMPKCTAAGCHDPHTPSWIYISALPPFQGTGMEVRAVSNREPFKPLAGPPVDPPVQTPVTLVVVTLLSALAASGALALLIFGKVKR